MAASHTSESLQEQIETTNVLLLRVHEGRAGFDKINQPETSKLVTTYYAIEQKLVKSFPEHPGSIDLVKVDRLGADELWRHADTILKEIEPGYMLLREISAVVKRNVQLLTCVANEMAPFSLDYTAEILHQYMQLFCDTGRLLLLLRLHPSKLTVQLFTLVHSHARLKGKSSLQQNLADRKAMVDLVTASEKPVLQLQQLFVAITPRISQILELIVSPVLSAFATAKETQELQMLNVLRPAEVDAACQQQLGMSASAAIRGLQLLPDLQEWAMFGLLICPEATVVPRNAKMMRQLLETNFRLHVYQDHSEWVHSLYETYVQPALKSHYKNVKGNERGYANRKASKEESKDAIDNAFSTARATCMQEHCARRNLAQQSLEQFKLLMDMDINQLPHNLQNIIAALTYGKTEVLWYFRNVNEVLPTGVLQTLQTQPLKENSTDPSVSGLIAAIHAMHDLLMQYRTGIQAFVISTIHGLVEQQISPVLVGLATTGPQANSKPVVDAVQVMASVIEHFEALQLPHQQQDSSAAADLVWAKSLWNSLTGSIFSASALITAAALDEASGHSGVLHFINQCIELSHYVDGFQNIMHRSASLAELCELSDKVVTCMRSTIQGPVDNTPFSSAWLYVLSCFQHVEHKSVGEEPSAKAVRLAQDYMRGVDDKVKALLLRLFEAHNSELAGPLTVSACYMRSQNAASAIQPTTSMSKTTKMATFTSATLSKAATLKNRVLTPTAAAPVFQPGHESLPANRGSLAVLAEVQTALTSLSRSLVQAPAIQLAPTFVMVPAEYLKSGLQSALKHQIAQLAFADKEIQRPSVLQGQVKRLVSLVHQLASVMPINASVLVREALLSCSCTEQAAANQPSTTQPNIPTEVWQSSRLDPQQSMKSDYQQSSKQAQLPAVVPVTAVTSCVEWYTTTVLRDQRGLGVSISQARKSFVSPDKPLDVALYASYEELCAFCQTWGLYGVKEMDARSKDVLSEAVYTLNVVLGIHEPLLQRLKAEYLDHQSCYEACRTASSSLRDVPQTLNALRIAARCLYLRLLLSDAAHSTLAAQTPAVAGLVSGSQTADAGYSKGRLSHMLNLPQKSSSSSPADVGARVDPALAQLIQGNGDVLSSQRWQLWSLLLALMHWSPECGKATLVGGQEALSNNMSCISFCSEALAATMPALATADEEDSIWTPVEAMRCYVRCSSSALQLSAPEGPGRMLMMDQLAADMQDRAMLEESHYAYTGIRTAYHQAFVPPTRQGTTAY